MITLLEWGVMVPLVLAVLFAVRDTVRMRQRASVYAELVLTLFLAGCLILLLRERTAQAPQRLVVVAEEPLDAAVTAALGSEAARDSCAAIVLRSGKGAGPAASFHDDCRAAFAAPEAASSIDAALMAARRALQSRSVLLQVWDFVRGTNLRVVMVARSAASWQRLQERIDVPGHIAAFAKLGATVSLLQLDGGGAQAWSNQLDIVPLTRRVSNFGAPDLRFRLALTGPPPPNSLSVSCVLGGDCLTDPDCPEQMQCVAGLCRAPCPAGTSCAAAERKPFVLRDATVLASAMDTTNGWWLDAAGGTPLDLRQFVPGEPLLGRQWAPLTCELATVEGGTKRTIARRSISVYGDPKKTTVIDVPGGRFLPGQRHAVDLSSVSSRSQLFLYATEKADRDELEASRAVVFNDIPAQSWRQQCPLLDVVASQGIPAIIGGLAKEAPCAKEVPLDVRHAPRLTNVVFDRQPGFWIDLDRSRIGRLPIAPSSQLLDQRPQDDPARDLLDGTQRHMVTVLLQAAQNAGALLGWSPSTLPKLLVRNGDEAEPFATFVSSSALDPAILASKAAGTFTSDMLAASSIPRRLADLLGTNRWDLTAARGLSGSQRVGLQDVIVMLAYVHPQCIASGEVANAAKLLSHGPQLVVLPISTVEPIRPDECPKTTQAIDIVTMLRQIAEQKEEGALGGRLADRIFLWHQGKLVPLARLAAGDVTPGPNDAMAQAAGALIAELMAPDRYRIRVAALERAIDERIVGSDPASFDPPITVAGGAPLRFEALDESSRDFRPVLRIGASDDPPERGWVLGVSAIVGNAPVLVLGYSPLEWLGHGFRFDVAWRDDPDKRLSVPGKDDRWGPQRIVDVVDLWADIHPGPTVTPRIRRVEYLDQTARLEVRQELSPGKDSIVPVVGRTGGDSGDSALHAAASSDCTEGKNRLRLVQFLPEEHAFVYEIPLQTRRELCGTRGCRLTLCREECLKPGAGKDCDSPDSFYLPAARLSSQIWLDSDPFDQLLALANYTGGGMIESAAPPLGSARRRTVFAVGCLLAAIWALVTLARLRRRRSLERSASRAVQRQQNDDVAATVREAGENLGHRSSQAPAGPVAGLRPLEVGDPLKSALRVDLLGALGAIPGLDDAILPRVVDRIREEPHRLRLVVNVGSSMRIPRASSAAPKLLGAARAAEAIAQIGWSGRAEVVIEAVGLQTGKSDGPHTVSPADGYVQRFLLDAARAPGTVVRRLGDSVEEGETVIILSDLLNERLDALQQRVEQIEFEGGAVGVVHLYWPGEHNIVEAGLDAANGMLVSRAGYGREELERAHELFVDELIARFGECAGGVLVMAVDIDATRMVRAVLESRIGGLLR